MSKGNRALRLSEVDETVQTENDIASWQAGLRAAMYDAITEEDVSAIVKRQVEKAKEGDAKAIEFVFGQVLGTKRAVTINQTTNQVVTDVETALALLAASRFGDGFAIGSAAGAAGDRGVEGR